MPSFFIRLGALAEVYVGDAAFAVDRGRRVIVRTDRGVEVAEIVGPSRDRGEGASSDDCNWGRATILRATTDEDELLIRRLERHKREAVESCRQKLSELGSTSTLLDVDQMFDGGTLVMHFLGAVDEVAQSVTSEVVQQYESIVRTRHFAKLLRDGCGPDCGTKDGGGCGSACSGCAVKCG